jgi:hypothetical protein
MSAETLCSRFCIQEKDVGVPEESVRIRYFVHASCGGVVRSQRGQARCTLAEPDNETDMPHIDSSKHDERRLKAFIQARS